MKMKKCKDTNAGLLSKAIPQKYADDFNETFAPVVNHSTIRFILSLAASKNISVEQLDVKTEFLYGEIEGLYMQQP